MGLTEWDYFVQDYLSDEGEMREGKLKSDLVNRLRARLHGAVVLRHEDEATAGVPDISITHKRRTVWIEVKFANPRVRGKDIQKHIARQLELVGHCFYVIYYMNAYDEEKTFVVNPKDLDDWMLRGVMEEGFHHDFVVDHVENIL